VIAVSRPPRYRREFILNGTYLRGFPYDGIQQEGIFFRRQLLEKVDLERLRGFRKSGDYFLWTQLAKGRSCTPCSAFSEHFEFTRAS
jgi:hypothetical protein